jgi:hypothetical protein
MRFIFVASLQTAYAYSFVATCSALTPGLGHVNRNRPDDIIVSSAASLRRLDCLINLPTEENISKAISEGAAQANR